MNAKNKWVTVSVIMLLVSSATAIGQTTEDVVAIRAEFAKAIDNHDLDAVASYFADDAVWYVTYIAEPLDTSEKRKAYLAEIYLGSPDTHTTEGLVLSSGNTVVVDHAMVGTHTHDQPGIPATGKAWVGPHMDVFDFEGGKIKKLTTYADIAGYLIQIGLMPAPPMPALVPSMTMPDPEPTGLSPMEAGAELVRRWSAHDVAGIAKMFHTDAKIFAGPLGVSLNRVQLIALNEMYFKGFTDAKLKTVRTLDMGNGWVVIEHVAIGTHDGVFMGVAPARYRVTVPAVWLLHFNADGLVTEQSFYYDNLTLMTQMTTAPFGVDGVWITKVPTPFGNYLMRCTYTAQDAAKTRFNAELEDINTLPLLAAVYPDSNRTKWAGGEAVAVGRNQYEATFLLYYTKTTGTNLEEIVGIATIKAYFELPAPDWIQGHGTGSYYMAAQDADQDGFPDDGEEPVVCLPWSWTSRRLTTMPGCTPTPMP